MFDFSFAEIALIVVVSVVFIGPKELPGIIRMVAKAMRALKGLTHELRTAFDDLARESGLEDAKKEFEHEMQLIKGDDGKFYEAYSSHVTADERPVAASQTTPH